MPLNLRKTTRLAFFCVACLAMTYPLLSPKPPISQVALNNAHTKSIAEELQLSVQTQPSLPRYVEASYSPLGRSPVVDAVLGDPHNLPYYGRSVSEKLKAISPTNSLYAMGQACLMAGGLPITADPDKYALATPVKVPPQFLASFGQSTGSLLYSYWISFMQAYLRAESALAALSTEEKRWLTQNYHAFFFGKPQKSAAYDFFTTANPMPFKFYSLAAKVDLVELAECALQLSAIVDDLYAHWADLAALYLKQDFVWEERNLKFVISTQDHATHGDNADFFIDAGGSNTIYSHAGGTSGDKAAALHIDLLGDNTYIGKDFVQGCGFLGVGVLASFSGSNKYVAQNYAQGCGFFGIGLLMNLGEDNQFELDFGGQSCALFGSSLLWTKGPKNSYLAREGMAQAAASTLGIAFLVANAGSDTYQCGVQGQGGTLYGGIGQAGSIGFRYYPWVGQPCLYGGVAFLYSGGSDNSFKIPWLGQGSAYFLGAALLVADGTGDNFQADYDSQGQGLHLAAGLLLKKGGHDRYEGGWGSLGVGADRSVGMFINTGGYNAYAGTEQSIGTARKPKALGVFIDTAGHNAYSFKKHSNASVQWPISPLEWPKALFLEFGGQNSYPQNGDEIQRGDNLSWGTPPHAIGIDSPGTEKAEKDELASLFALFPETPRVPFAFNPDSGWTANTAYRPLKVAAQAEQLQQQIAEIPTADYDRRRQLYESIDLLRFSHPSFEVDLSSLLENPEMISEDQFNYAALWAIQNGKCAHYAEVAEALASGRMATDYARKLAIAFITRCGPPEANDLLAQVMQEDPSEENRATAARFLALRITSATLDLLKPGLESPSEMVRYGAVKGLQDSPVENVLPLISARFDDASFYVRRAAAMAAISLKDKAGIPVLLETLEFDTLDTEDNYGDNLYNTLAKYVGVNFGLDRAAWMLWWQKSQATFAFPDKT